jgi:hypothetical protein
MSYHEPVPPDAYTTYEAGLRRLLDELGPDHPRYRDALTHEQRLAENFQQSRLDGDTETRRSERSEIIRQLNGLALGVLGISFNDLCDQVSPPPTRAQASDADQARPNVPPHGAASMPSRSTYAIVGLFVGAAVDLGINLLAAALREQAFADHFSQGSLWGLLVLTVAGLLVGYWLGGPVQVPAPASRPAAPPDTSGSVTITRLRALLSYARLRGKGIHLSDILLIGSRIEIDTED